MRRSPRERREGQRSAWKECARKTVLEREGELALRRDREEVRAGVSGRDRVERVEPDAVDGGRRSVPRRAEDDCPAIRGEARTGDLAALEGEALELRLGPLRRTP